MKQKSRYFHFGNLSNNPRQTIFTKQNGYENFYNSLKPAIKYRPQGQKYNKIKASANMHGSFTPPACHR